MCRYYRVTTESDDEGIAMLPKLSPGVFRLVRPQNTCKADEHGFIFRNWFSSAREALAYIAAVEELDVKIKTEKGKREMVRRIKLDSGLINAAERITRKRYSGQPNYADIRTEYLDYDKIPELIGDLIEAATGHKQKVRNDV